jgi:NADPH:quinone reductase-like Zn-dependent oxidoreductase
VGILSPGQVGGRRLPKNVKAAIVTEVGKPPVYGDFKEPTPADGEVRLSVRAAALSNLAKSRASDAHYSSSGELPFVVGVDGVGQLEDGRRVYFVFPRAPFGSMAERTVVPRSLCAPIPDDLDDVTAAAIANPGMSSWGALKERAKLSAGETVLVNGATGTAGRLAIQIAKHLGAGKVVATGRDAAALRTLRVLGADVTIPFGDGGDGFEAAVQAQFRGDGIDVVLDYLWGSSAEHIIRAAANGGRPGVPIRFVEIGTVTGPNITLPGAALRSRPLTLMGSGIGSIPNDRIVSSIGELMQAAGPSGFQVATQSYPLSEIEHVWTIPERPRPVLQMH